MGPGGQETPLSVCLVTGLCFIPKTHMYRYWDWAEPRVAQEGLPPVLYEDKLTITIAGGKTTTVNNPFSYYTYQTGIPSDFENDPGRTVCL